MGISIIRIDSQIKRIIYFNQTFSYTNERQGLVDYSHGIGVDAMNWISKPPGKLPPSTNIVRTFDYYSWVMIAFSLIAVWYIYKVKEQ